LFYHWFIIHYYSNLNESFFSMHFRLFLGHNTKILQLNRLNKHVWLWNLIIFSLYSREEIEDCNTFYPYIIDSVKPNWLTGRKRKFKFQIIELLYHEKTKTKHVLASIRSKLIIILKWVSFSHCLSLLLLIIIK
jgi:hypothetical protein